MGLRTKGAISSFVQSGNFESLTLTGFEPATLRVAVGPKLVIDQNIK